MTLDPVVARLLLLGIQVTRASYPSLAYPERAPDPLPAELEAIVEEAPRVAR